VAPQFVAVQLRSELNLVPLAQDYSEKSELWLRARFSLRMLGRAQGQVNVGVFGDLPFALNPDH
jgi:hypothetical protein